MRWLRPPRHIIVTRRTLLAIVLASTACSPSGTPTTPTSTPSPSPIPALAITCPSSQSAASLNGNPVAVNFAAAASSGGVAPVQVSCTRASGSLFPVGTTVVQCTATDAATITRSCTFSVTVAPPPPQLSRTKFLAFGDSTTAGEIPMPAAMTPGDEAPNFKLIVVPAASYPSQLLPLLRGRYTGQMAAIEIINSGLPNEWAEDGALRLPGVLANARPQAVLLLEGVNDLGALGTRGIQSAWRAIDTMAKEIRNRGARALIATIPPPRPSGTKAVPIALIQSLNANIRDTVRGEGAVLVDLFAALSTDVNRYISVDGLHPTEAGYQRIAETFYDAIRQDLEIR